VAFAPNVRNVVVVQAENEYRTFFKGVDYSGSPGVTVLQMLGNHVNIGGGYDNGIGALVLEGTTQLLRSAGVPIADGRARPALHRSTAGGLRRGICSDIQCRVSTLGHHTPMGFLWLLQ
jgi:hypothetical protein